MYHCRQSLMDDNVLLTCRSSFFFGRACFSVGIERRERSKAILRHCALIFFSCTFFFIKKIIKINLITLEMKIFYFGRNELLILNLRFIVFSGEKKIIYHIRSRFHKMNSLSYSGGRERKKNYGHIKASICIIEGNFAGQQKSLTL